MELDTPSWFKQRQAKAEELTRGTYRVSGPNLPEAVLSVQFDDNLRWKGVLKNKDQSKGIAATPATFMTPKEAMNAAFELYRIHMIL